VPENRLEIDHAEFAEKSFAVMAATCQEIRNIEHYELCRVVEYPVQGFRLRPVVSIDRTSRQ
jgi:hypothetical protein